MRKYCKQFLRSATLVCSAIGFLTPGFAAPQPFAPGRLKIVLQSSPVAPDSPDAQEQENALTSQWTEACQSLGQTFILGKGPWGTGIFSSVSCYLGEKLILGKNEKSNWILRVSDTTQEFSQTLVQILPDGKEQVVARNVIAPSKNALGFLADEEYVDLLALKLQESLPFNMRVSKKAGSAKIRSIKGRMPRIGAARDRKFTLPDPPSELVLYDLAFDPSTGLWLSEVRGKAKLRNVEEISAHERRKLRGKRSLIIGNAIWDLDAAATQATKHTALWAHAAAGPGGRAAEFKDVLESAHGEMVEADKKGTLGDFMRGGFDAITAALLDTAASGYIGIRYGKQVLFGDPLLEKTSFFGLLAEIRGGPVEGLRVYYDKLPKVETTIDDFETHLSWSRIILGKSWGWKPSILVDRVDITPKIGVWTLDAALASSRDDEGKVTQVSRFKLNRELGLALEAGLEWSSTWYLLRAWYAVDTAVKLGRYGGSSITSNRFGFDSYWTAGPIYPVFGIPFHTGLLAFYVFESVSLSGRGDSDEAAVEGQITGLTYDGGYAGLGLVVSW